MKMSKDSSATYSQKTKKGFKKACEKYQNHFEKQKKNRRKTKSKCLVLRNIKIFLRIKNKDWLSIEKNIKYGKIEPLHK